MSTTTPSGPVPPRTPLDTPSDRAAPSTRMALNPNAVARHRPGEVPLVVLHGFPLDHRMWNGVVAALAADGGVPVLVPDAPGFGSSPALAGAQATAGIEGYARALLGSLDAAGYGRVVLAGLSMGGYVAQAVAALAPERLAGLALLDTNPFTDDDATRAERLSVARRAEGGEGAAVVAEAWRGVLGTTTQLERPEVVAQVQGWLAQVRPEAVVWAQRAMAQRPERISALHELASGTNRVLAVVIRGQEDVTCPADTAALMAQALDCGVVTVPGAGHMSGLEVPEPVADALRSLWERATRTPPRD